MPAPEQVETGLRINTLIAVVILYVESSYKQYDAQFTSLIILKGPIDLNFVRAISSVNSWCPASPSAL